MYHFHFVALGIRAMLFNTTPIFLVPEETTTKNHDYDIEDHDERTDEGEKSSGPPHTVNETHLEINSHRTKGSVSNKLDWS